MRRHHSPHLHLAASLCLFWGIIVGAADEDWKKGWQQRWYKKSVVTEPAVVKEGNIQLPLTFPGDNEFTKPVAKGWNAYQSVSFTVNTPSDLAPNCDVYFFVKDWDDLWYQIRLGPLQPGETRSFDLPLHGTEATARWQPRFHFRPWHQRSPTQIRECGIKFGYTPANTPSDFKTTATLSELRLSTGDPKPDSGPSVRTLPRTPISPKAGDCIEIALETTLPYLDPFDKSEVNLTGTVIRPDGAVDVVRLFYYEDFLFDWQDGHSPLTPSGTPQFRFRYTPVEPGTYTISISGSIGGTQIELPSHEVSVEDSDFKGFVRPATFDKRLLMYSRTGTEFWGAALNTRSPYDTRYMDSFPFSQWPKRGISIYRDLFRKYKECGINIIELWMSDWFLGLESIPNAPGAHGIGYMNQHRAWRLDLLMQWAKEFDLHVVILLNNHGKFSTWCDADWKTTAINKEQGGFLDQPAEFFTDKRAHASFEKFADYAVARWGYSPNLFTWKLFSEIDLTGKNRSWYKTPPVKAWHRKMGAYMTAQDPNRHMITTHWAESYKLVNEDLAKVPEIDILTLDAYYRGTGPKLGVDILTGTIKFAEKMGKPCVVTEYGGNPWADGVQHMMNGHHLASWIGFFGMLPNSPGYWWYPMVEEKDMYERYAALNRFVKGETRAGGKTSWNEKHSEDTTLWTLKKDQAAFYWLYDEPSFYNRMQNEPLRRREGESVTIKDLPAGTWRVEFWSTQKGEVLSTRQIELTDSPFKLDLPPFRGDVAIKVKPANGN